MTVIPERRIKCLVWDLDQTLWSGILLEGGAVALRPGICETITELDRRGILQSIASQNDPALAIEQLRVWGLFDYFLHPQISLPADKSFQVSNIASLLSFQLEHIAFIDDDPRERAYVAYALPAVAVLRADQALTLTQMAMFIVDQPTEEARRRREFHRADAQRRAVEHGWRGRRLDFLRHCRIVLVLRRAAPEDAPRIAELVERTNQLNVAAYHFNERDILGQIGSPDYRLTVARMSDRFGDYGTVGAMIIRQLQPKWLIEVLLVSCRAMGRGVGEALLCCAIRQASEQGRKSLHALYRMTDYNRAMYTLFVTHGFKREQKQSGVIGFVRDLTMVPDYPDYPAWLDVQIP